MKLDNLARYSILIMLLVGTTLFITSCGDDDNPPPVEECTFVDDADCFCEDADNALTTQCLDFLAAKVCEYDDSEMYIRLRESSDAGVFTFVKMADGDAEGQFTFTQNAISLFADGSAGFGNQVFEFVTQADYGQVEKNGEKVAQLQTDGNNRAITLTNGVGTGTLLTKKVFTVAPDGSETEVASCADEGTNSFQLSTAELTATSVITYTIDLTNDEVAVEVTEGDPCDLYDKSVAYIRWRNSSDAGNFTWDEMTSVDGQAETFTISQLGENYFTADGVEANFGAQILEFSNQPGYGQDLLNGQPVSLYRNDRNNDGWLFPAPTNGLTSKTAQFVQVISVDAGGESTLCAPPDGANSSGFRLNDVPALVSRNSQLTYTFAASTGEVALEIEEVEPCDVWNQTKLFAYTRAGSDAGVFTDIEMTATAPGVFTLTQNAADFYVDGSPGFGNQVIQFITQEGFGQTDKDGRRWAQIQTTGSDRDLSFTAGSASKTLLKRKVATVSSTGVESVICEDASANSIRLSTSLLTESSVITYTVDLNTLDLAVVITEP